MKTWSRIGWFLFIVGILILFGVDWDFVDGGAQTKWQRTIMVDICLISSLFCFGIVDILEAIEGKGSNKSQ